MADNVTTVGPTANDQQLTAALLMAGFSNNTIIGNMIRIADWESGKTPQVNANASESPKGFSGCKSVGVWQINYCPARDKGTIREQAANNPADLVLNARAAYLLSNGGQNLNIWSTWVNRNATNPSIAAGGAVGGGPLILSNTSPFLGQVINDPQSLKDIGHTSQVGCSSPTGINALNPAAWIAYIVCEVQTHAVRAGEMVLGIILLIVGIMMVAKIAGDKTGATQAIQSVATAAAVA